MSASLKKKLREHYIRARLRADKLLGRRTVIFDIEELSFIPHFLPLYTQLRKKSNSISYYIATHYPGNEALDVFGISKLKQFPVKLSRKLNKADLFISAHIYGVGSGSSYKIHINHNQPVKYQSYRKEDFVNFNAHFLTSPLHRQQTEDTIKAYGLHDRKIDLFDIGYSKSDDLLNGKFERDEVLKGLGLPAENKTVLYAPSWDEGLSLRTSGRQIIAELLKLENVNVIVKLHPISYCSPDGPNYMFYTGGVDWKKELSEFESNSNFRHIPVSSIDPLLSASDIMVTDVSSVALEFIMLDKPVVYIDCPDFYEKTLSKVYSEFGETTAEFVKNDPKANAGRHTGVVVEKVSDLRDAVLKCLSDPGENSAKRKQFSKQLAYNHGKAGEVAADTVMKILRI